MRGAGTVIVVGLAGALLLSGLAAGMWMADTPSATSRGTTDAPEGTFASASASETAPSGAKDVQRDDETEHDHAGAHDHDAAPQGETPPSPELEPTMPRHEHFRAGEDGDIPARADAANLPFQLKSVSIQGDEGLAKLAAQGYLLGTGTASDPYIIEGFRVREDLSIVDTTKAIIVRNSLIEGALRLNYNGDDVYVHHNRLFDLRVNENIKRTADTTAGLFEHNEIAFIGQLRHFGGEFGHNTVGPKPEGVVTTFLSDSGERPLAKDLVWNFDGYHGAHVHNNTVLGQMDIKLHGHFHGTCSACLPHDHAEPTGFPDDGLATPGHAPRSIHSLRYHTLDLEHNTVIAEQPVALRLNDMNHVGDDRRANSEPNPYLEDAHEHHTFVRIAHNVVQGGAFQARIINPADELHEGHVQEALVHLHDNEVTLPVPRGSAVDRAHAAAAYDIRDAHNAVIHARDNDYRFTDEQPPAATGHRWITEPASETAGLRLTRGADLDVFVVGTQGHGAAYGVWLQAVQEHETINVSLERNQFNAKEDMHRA